MSIASLQKRRGFPVPMAKRAPKQCPPPTDLYVSQLLEKISDGKHVMSFRKGEKVFSQGAQADAIYFVHAGKVKITVVSSTGKEAVLALLGPHEFFGEGSLVGQSLRVSTATTMEAA